MTTREAGTLLTRWERVTLSGGALIAGILLALDAMMSQGMHLWNYFQAEVSNSIQTSGGSLLPTTNFLKISICRHVTLPMPTFLAVLIDSSFPILS